MTRGPSRNALIVDDDRMTRMQLCTHLRAHTRLRVCGEAADLATARGLARTTQPDFIILELPLAGTEDAAALAALHECAPRAQFVVIGEDDGFAWQQRVFAAGALGVVHRNDAPEAVVLALGARIPPFQIDPLPNLPWSIRCGGDPLPFLVSKSR